MIEEKIDKLTAAVEKLEATIRANGGTGGGAAASTGDKPKKTTAKADKPKHDAEKVKAAILDVKEKLGADTARAIIEGAAGAGKKLADLINMPEKFDAAVAACAEAFENQGDEPEEEEDEI